VLNFVAVSDNPIQFDAARWEGMLRTMRRTDGTPVFDTTDSRVAARLDTLLGLPATLSEAPRMYGLETRESVLRRKSTARIVTDDNMQVEWRPSPVSMP
jgi:hypothetical protein